MHRITRYQLADADRDDVLRYLTDYDLEHVHDLYDDFSYEWCKDVVAQLDERLLKPNMTDIEALRHAGFDVPSFFYEVVRIYNIVTLDYPARGGGFSCIT